ncbi:hypothetical protein MLB55_003395 [Salmonella enterica]|nr:hypothetical protein [Salmonella enterica subsp. enterica serovar Newport]EIT8740300.1 hypothetical protein [Salmonella enterica]EIR7959235.1 hypothetical protein [Salmonella enterica subsp. enterica serovar Newport]EIX8421723.1 hypothetical protein [Salmonella enterica]EJP4120313.1 hypothetical protein [Salmonella enterica subsp. enterica serovar Newport]
MSGLLPYFVNLRAKVKSGLKDVVFWISAKSDARALREMENALEDADIKRSAFFKDAIITGLPVYNDLPQEGELDFTWCERYAFSDDTGTWLPIAPAQPVQPEPADSDNASISEGHTDEYTTDNTDPGDTSSATSDASTDTGAATAATDSDSATSAAGSANAAANTSTEGVGTETATTATDELPAWEFNVNGERMADVEKEMLQTTAGDTSDLQNAKNGETGSSTRPRRSEKPTHRTINYELGCGFYDDLDFDNLRPAMDFAKRIIAEDREDWKRMSITAGIIPDIKEFDRQTIIDLVRKAPKAVLTGSPELRRTWCESFLAVHGVRDPDWYEYVPNKAAATHEENLETVRKAGKCLRDIEAGRFQCDEEKPQPAAVLADEPAATETVEPDTTEHHQDPQQVETESSVADDGEQALREKVSKQLAAGRGDFVPGISDPSDPKWVHNDYSASASNEGEKTENEDADEVNQNDDTVIQNTDSVNHSEPSADQIEPEVPETEPKSLQPEPVTKVADGVFEASAFFADTSNQGEKTEIPQPDNDDRTTKEAQENSPDKAPDESDSTPEILLLLRQINQAQQQILASQLRIEKAHRKDTAAIRGMLAMMYAAETEEDTANDE